MISSEWLAGFIDGEGSFYIFRAVRKTKKGIKIHEYPNFGITQKTGDVLRQIRNFLGFGNLVHLKGHHYGLMITKREDLLELIKKLDGLLIVKKIQFDEWKKHPYFTK